MLIRKQNNELRKCSISVDMLFCTVDHSNELVGFYKFLILNKPKEKNLKVSHLENEAAIHCHCATRNYFFSKNIL